MSYFEEYRAQRLGRAVPAEANTQPPQVKHSYAEQSAIMGWGVPKAFAGPAPKPAADPSTPAPRKSLQDVSSKPHEEQHYQLTANALMAGPISDAQRKNDQRLEDHLTHVAREGAEFCKETSMNSTQTRQFMQGISYWVNRLKTRTEILPYDREYFISKHGAEYENLVEQAKREAAASLVNKPNMQLVIQQTNAGVHRDVIEPVLEAIADRAPIKEA
jgi:hypothetical protein